MRFLNQSLTLAAVSLALVGSPACGPEVDLAKSVQLVDVQILNAGLTGQRLEALRDDFN